MPGVTVDRAEACIRNHPHLTLVDLPGTYSLYAQSPDEQIAQEALFSSRSSSELDAIWVVIDTAHFKSSLFLLLQVLDMGFPTLVVLNRTDGTVINGTIFKQWLGIDAVELNAADGSVDELLEELLIGQAREAMDETAHLVPRSWEAAFEFMRGAFPEVPDVRLSWMLRLHEPPSWWSSHEKAAWSLAKDELDDSPAAMQLEETGWRMNRIRKWSPMLLPNVVEEDPKGAMHARHTSQIDRVLTHPVWGHLILAATFFGIFQAVYSWSAYPMDAVDSVFGMIHNASEALLPETWWRSLLLDGLLNGIAGIVVFVPQIMILFGLTAALEATGYMARVGFLGDRFLQRLGLSGRSIVPLVGGMACAVPAVMAARSIPGKRERLLTILITPLMTCSARLPVYVFLIGFIVPDASVIGGLFNQQGLFLFCLYLASSAAALILSWILHRGLPVRKEAGFTLEWPAYRWPKGREVLQEMASKGWSFVSSAGQVILIVSMVLWGLGRFGPSDKMAAVTQQFSGVQELDQRAKRDAALLEASWLGQLGDWIEPVFRPLGYDGRMGIAILSSFAAREVFVGTLSTLYPTADRSEGSIRALQKRLGTELHPATGKPLLNVASAASLIVFYMFAMQCMSTVAVVQRELKSWTWALGQAFSFTAVAYALGILVYQLFA